MIKISVNDQIQNIDDPKLDHLLGKLQGNTGSFAVAVNGEFVPRSHYHQTTLQNGDRLDIVSPVGGG